MFFLAGSVLYKIEIINCEKELNPIYPNHLSDYTKNYHKKYNFIMYLSLLIYSCKLLKISHADGAEPA